MGDLCGYLLVMAAILGLGQADNLLSGSTNGDSTPVSTPVLDNAGGVYTINLANYGDKTGINFLDAKYTELQVSVDGLVQFGPATGTLDYPAMPVTDSTYGPYMAVYSEQVDILLSAGSKVRVTIVDAAIGDTFGWMADANPGGPTGFMKDYFQNIAQDYTATNLVIVVSWQNVVSFGDTDATPITNTFQLALLTDGCQTYALFNYNAIGWTAAAADSGRKCRAAISAGDGVTALELPDSETAASFQLVTGSNVNDPARAGGWFWFRVDRAAVMELCPAACETFNFGTCEKYGCACADPAVTKAVDCTDTIYSDMCWEVSLTECATPCGGCSQTQVEKFCDKCAGSLGLETKDCNVQKCTPGVDPLREYLYKNGRRIGRNRKCCYKFGPTVPVKLSPTRFPDGKSCCRPRVKGWNGPNAPTC